MGFLGFMDEGVAATFLFQLVNGSNVPKEPDTGTTPSFRVYGAGGEVVASGTGSASAAESGAVTGATNASPIVVTAAAHGVSTGQAVTIASVGGNTAANGDFLATYVSPTTFSLQGSTGNGAYTSGGTWRTTGLYKVVLTGAILNSLEAGKTYTIILTYTVGAANYTLEGTFTVR